MSFVTSLVMASVDIARAAKAPIAASIFADLILDRGDREYALPWDSHGAKQIADAIVALPLAIEVLLGDRPLLSGIMMHSFPDRSRFLCATNYSRSSSNKSDGRVPKY